MSEEKPKVDLNVVQVLASALAAVSSAVLLSSVGVAGTVIGAAVGSVIATVAGAVYSYSLQASRDRVAAAAQVAAMARAGLVRRSQSDGPETPQGTQPLSTRRKQASQEDPDPAEVARPQWREALGALSWKRVAAVTSAVFLAAMVAIVAFELVAGQPVSVYTGGTSTTSHSRTTFGGGTATPSKEPSPSSAPSSDASSSDPSTASSDDPSASATSSPTASASSSPTDAASATESPTGDGAPGASPTEAPADGATPTPVG